MGFRRLVIDNFSALSHKEMLGDDARSGSALHRTVPTWVPDEDRRRLAAYLIRAAYLSNCGRDVLPSTYDDAKRSEHREYGDAGLLVDRLVSGILGEDWTVSVDGADAALNDLQLPARPNPSGSAAGTLEARLEAFELAQWEARAKALLDGWEAAAKAQPAAKARQVDLRYWVEQVQLGALLDEMERKATGLGDGVLVLWPGGDDKTWPTASVHDPGFYFPEYDDDGGIGGFPDRVHLAWEFESTDGDGRKRRMVRRMTWELGSIQDSRTGSGIGGETIWVGPDGLASTTPKLYRWERLGSNGLIGRRYPWETDGTVPYSGQTCLYSDGVWDLSDVGKKVDALDDSRATWTYYRSDLGIDFIPVVHIPNTTSSGEHFGRSAIDLVAQLLDDVATNDTDAMAASRYLAAPTIALSGAALPSDEHGISAPGRIFGVGAQGRMDVLDLSAGVAQLMAQGVSLLDRFWVNGRVPREMIGRVDASQAPSGLALALTFAPFAQVVGTARLTRGPKIELILKFAQRMAMVNNAITTGPIPRARFNFGSFLPMDRTEIVKDVTEALRAHAMSTQTAVTMLAAAGIPVDDASAEVQRIMAENPEAAASLADALAGAPGADAIVAGRLGVKLTEATAPIVELEDEP